MKCLEDMDFNVVQLTFYNVDFTTFDAVEFDAAILSLSKGSKTPFLFFDSNQRFLDWQANVSKTFF